MDDDESPFGSEGSVSLLVSLLLLSNLITLCIRAESST
jgi:hypothetical protein